MGDVAQGLLQLLGFLLGRAALASGELKAPEEQAPWLGQPSHAEAFPASSATGPTHPALASEGASEGVAVVMVIGLVLEL